MGWFKTKKIKVRDPQTEELEVVQLWEVRWWSRHGEYSADVRPQVKVFPDKEDAVKFKEALEDAFKLIGHTSGTSVKMGIH